MIQNLNHLPPVDPEDRSGDGDSLDVELTVFGVIFSLCFLIVIYVVLRNIHKARQEQPVGARQEQPVDNGPAIQRAHTAIAAVVDVPTENSIANVPTATSMHVPIANATLTTPPASEDLDLPIAVAQPL